MTKWKWKSKSESKSKSKPLETEPIKSETELAWERGEEWRPEPKFANLSPPNKRQTTINPATLFMTILYPPAVIFPILGDIASHRLGSGGNLDSKSGSSTPTSSTEAKAKQGRVVKEIVDGIIIYENPEDRNSHETPRAVGVKSTVSASDSSFPKMGHDAPTPNETSMVAEARANEASARKNVPTKDLIIGYGFIGAVLAGLYWLVRVVGGALNGNVSSPASGATAESHQKSNGIAAWLIISAVVLCFLACLGNSSGEEKPTLGEEIKPDSLTEDVETKSQSADAKVPVVDTPLVQELGSKIIARKEVTEEEKAEQLQRDREIGYILLAVLGGIAVYWVRWAWKAVNSNLGPDQISSPPPPTAESSPASFWTGLGTWFSIAALVVFFFASKGAQPAKTAVPPTRSETAPTSDQTLEPATSEGSQESTTSIN